LTHTADELRRELTAAREAGTSVGLVPTMGALHEGHLSLVDACRRDGGLTVVTLFVNPAQFGAGEDFAAYPRSLDADLKLLSGRGADVVFAPETDAVYRAGHATYVEVGGLALPLEGEFRPGHFRGVATIVLKLFHLVQPDRAYFGRKDYQQSLVVRRMVADLDLPIEIVVCPIVREPDGLAMSSRNAYLSAEERSRALAISQSLRRARQLVAEGTRDARAIVADMRELLRAADLNIDYAAICDPETLEPLARVDGPAVALVAARVGRARLIDNEMLG
jgi:pantoate--beta-alanine ligase